MAETYKRRKRREKLKNKKLDEANEVYFSIWHLP
jgi:hypothetical protein